MDCSPPGSFVHGIFPASTLEWLAIFSSKGSSWARDWTHISCIEPTFPASPALQANSPLGKPCHSFITLYCGPLPCVMVKIKKSIKGTLNICLYAHLFIFFLYAHLTMNIFFCLKSNCLVISCWETIPKLVAQSSNHFLMCSRFWCVGSVWRD